MGAWAFITNHGMALTGIATNPKITAREIADKLGITERSTRRIIPDLEAAGYLSKTKDGRLNHYEINPEMPRRHPEHQNIAVGKLLKVLLKHGNWVLT